MGSIGKIVVNVFATLGLLCGLTAQAQDFRVDNKLIIPGVPQPIESTTLFAAGKAYDFLEASQEAIVFDRGANSIVILDLANETKAEVATGDVSTEINRLHEAARASRREFVRMSASPKFSQSVDSRTGRLTLDSKWTRYVVSTEAPRNAFAAVQYNEFADWMTQLNALLNPPKMPFARLKLNDVLKQRQEIPIQIELTSHGEDQKKPLVVRAEHRLHWDLSPADRARIEAVARQLETFEKVPLGNFQRPPREKDEG